MLKAFIMLNVEPGTEFEVFERVRVIPGVKEAYVLYGIYDIAVHLEVDGLKALYPVLIEKIRRLPFLKASSTMIVK